jgi:hypothetical protein
MTKYKLFNTDGKTFFDFRSSPDSRCEGFTLTFCDDGTVVMSGDYGTLCWKRNYHHAEDKDFKRDYGFPNDETGIGYFAEKVCQFGVEQKIKEFNLEKAKELFKERYKEMINDEKYKEALEQIDWLEEYDEVKFRDIVSEVDCDSWEYDWLTYTYHFNFMFGVLKGVSQQILDAVNKEIK